MVSHGPALHLWLMSQINKENVWFSKRKKAREKKRENSENSLTWNDPIPGRVNIFLGDNGGRALDVSDGAAGILIRKRREFKNVPKATRHIISSDNRLRSVKRTCSAIYTEEKYQSSSQNFDLGFFLPHRRHPGQFHKEVRMLFWVRLSTFLSLSRCQQSMCTSAVFRSHTLQPR